MLIPPSLTPTPDQLQLALNATTHTLTPVWAFISSFLILFILIIVLVGFSRIMGYGPYIGLIAALYIGYALYVAFPYVSYLPTGPALTALAARVALYLLFFGISYVLLRRVAASDFVELHSLGVIVTAFLTAGFIMTLAYQTFPVQAIYHFSPQLDKLFAAKEWGFAWFAAPILGLMVFARKR